MILTLVEKDLEGAPVDTSLEALTFARTLSAEGGGIPVDAVVVGELSDELRKELATYGVRTIHQVGGEPLAAYSGAGWASAILTVRELSKSVVVLAAGTDRGNELMAHVAARAGVAMAANVLSFHGLSPFTVTRQVVGGAALEEMVLDQRPAVFSVAGHAVEARPAETPGAADVVEHTPEIDAADLVARVVSTDEPETDDSGGLKTARVVVGAGRGAGGPDGFKDIEELTSLLHAALGVSRVVTAAGWRPHHEQVGQTGSRISPDLYIPCGISGAIQHWAGCSSAKTILAINTDPEAPMVTRATYAVIGDLHEVVPAINEEIRRRRGLVS
jgi:electron transfer flavoprotein alpha subunit